MSLKMFRAIQRGAFSVVKKNPPQRSVQFSQNFTRDRTLIHSIDASTRVAEVQLNRPKALNACSRELMAELHAVMSSIGRNPSVRAVVLHGGSAKGFTSGLDLLDHASLLMPSGGSDTEPGPSMDPARRAISLHHLIRSYQDTVSSLEACRVPVISVIHGPCVGAGLDIITACDIRVAAADATFCAAEVSIGLAPDIGTLQRLPRCLGNDSIAREWILTGCSVTAQEALGAGLLSAVLPTLEEALAHGRRIARTIAAHSPIAVQTAKAQLNFSRGRTVADGLTLNAAVNAAALQSADIHKAAMEAMSGRGKQQAFKDPGRFPDV